MTSAQNAATADGAQLSVKGLTVQFRLRSDEILRAVDGIDLDVHADEVHGLVGESGSGKTVAAFAILGLHDAPTVRIGGAVRWRGHDLLGLPERDLRTFRGREIAMVFQNAITSLNPALRIGTQLGSVLRLHRGLDGPELQQESERLLAAVQIPDPARILRSYAFECSGGMAQRIALAMALACRPSLLIADEPTSGLDATIAAQVVELLRSVRKEFSLSLLLISHDLGLIAQLCDRVSVMYLGRIVESASASDLFAKPLHPYTEALLNSVAVMGPGRQPATVPLRGEVPSPVHIPSGCRFHPRCPQVMTHCREEQPLLEPCGGPGRNCACWLHAPSAQPVPPNPKSSGENR